MKKFFGEFKTFITRGNIVDMAVGVIVGGAFTAIVNGLSNFVLKPLINWFLALILGKDALSELFTFLKTTVDATTGEIDLANSIYIDWGSLINAIINFIITAFVLFCIVKAINTLKDGKELKPGKYSKADKKAMKAQGIKLKDKAAVDAYFAAKAEKKAKADAEAAEKARLEREANPTAEDLLKKILVALENK